MFSFLIISILITLVVGILISRYKGTINQPFILMGDILIIFSSTFGSMGLLNYLLTTNMKTPLNFDINTIFFIIISIITLLFSNILYKRAIDNFNIIWLLSEFFMGLGITIVLLSLIYLYTNTMHISDDILKQNFYSLFLDSNSEKYKENLKIASNLFVYILGGGFIGIALALNAKRIGKKI